MKHVSFLVAGCLIALSPLTVSAQVVPVLPAVEQAVPAPTSAPASAPSSGSLSGTSAPSTSNVGAPSAVPQTASAISEEELRQLEQALSNPVNALQAMGLSSALLGNQRDKTDFQDYDPSLMRELEILGLEEDPVLRQAFRLPIDDAEAYLREIGKIDTQTGLDKTRASALNARLDLYRNLMAFRSTLYDAANARATAINAAFEMSNRMKAKDEEVVEEKKVEEEKEAVVEEVVALAPTPTVSAIYTIGDQRLARIEIGEAAFVVEEGQILPSGHTVVAIEQRQVVLFDPEKEQEVRAILYRTAL